LSSYLEHFDDGLFHIFARRSRDLSGLDWNRGCAVLADPVGELLGIEENFPSKGAGKMDGFPRCLLSDFFVVIVL
jgi:hypothetical protein